MKHIYGVGPKDADIMLVGEAWGTEEAARQEPFVGPSGRLLDNCLADVGILRTLCYITNVVNAKPRGNNINQFLKVGKKHTWESPEYREHLERLKEEIISVNPNVIVALGGTALWALCGQQGISNWRGSILESTLVPGKKVVCCLHPASALRIYIWRHFIKYDLKRALEHSASPEIPKDNRTYILEPSFEEALDYCQRCQTVDRFAFDIEVNNRELSCFSLSLSAEEAISIPLTDHGQRDYFSLEQEIEILRALGKALAADNECVAHNAVFDSTFLFRKYGMRPKNVHDTMIAEGILYPEFPKSLAFVTSLWTEMPYYKEEGKVRMKYGTGPDFWLYNAKDSVVLMEALPKIIKALNHQGNFEAYERQRGLIEPFIFMSERGIRIDKEMMATVRSKTKKEIKAITASIHEAVGYDLNPKSPKQVKEFFYDVKGLKPYIDYKTHKPTTNETALKRLSKHSNLEVAVVAKALLRLRYLDKMRGTYYEMTLDPDDRLRCSMNPVGTKFGRPSSSKTIFGTGANLQNQPPESKRFMLPDEGYILYKADLQQAENRVVAWLADDARMIEAFESGIDVHALVASLIFGGEPSKEYQDTTKAPLGQGRFTQRYWGKKANHGSNYGMTAPRASLLWEIPQGEAKTILERYHRAFPNVRLWHSQIQRQLGANRYLHNLLGRRYQFWDRWGDSLFKEAYAYIPQSSVAEFTNQAFIWIYHNIPEAELLLIEHDGLYFQVPLSCSWQRHSEILLEVKKAMDVQVPMGARTLVIPTDLAMLPFNFDSKNPKTAFELKDLSPPCLETTYQNAMEMATT